jgi:mitogen-activated protein kinase kinase kinase
MSNATHASSVPAEIAAQWPLDRVIAWLQANNFSKEWQETFKFLNLYGMQFLELGGSRGGRGNFGMMHQQVYPRLLIECRNSGTPWDQPKEREEGKRMRRLIRSIVTGKPVETSKTSSTGHSRKESGVAPAPGAGADSGDSPNVSESAGTKESLCNGIEKKEMKRRRKKS